MIYRLIFLVIFLALPVNDLPYLRQIFGELSSEAAFYPLLLLLVIFPFELFQRHIKIPSTYSFYILIFFILYLFVSGLFNSPDIFTAVYAKRTGISKFVLQFAVLLFCVSVAIVIYNLVRREIITIKIFHGFIYASFALAGGYSIFELLFHAGNPVAVQLLELINPLIHTEDQGIFYYERIRSLCGEPSWFGMYAAFIYPWLAVNLIRGRHFLLALLTTGYLLVLVILSGSRTAYGLIFFQSALLTVLAARFLRGFSIFKTALLVALAVLALIIGRWGATLLVPDPQKFLAYVGLFQSLTDVEENISNITRFATQLAALKMALDHPVFGVGLGQYAFHFHQYLPAWAMVSYEIRWYLMGVSAAAPVHGLFSRLAAEGGFPALGLWLLFWVSLFREVYGTVRDSYMETGETDWSGVALLVSLIGTFLVALNIDSFRFPGYWLGIGLAWGYCVNAQEARIARAGATAPADLGREA